MAVLEWDRVGDRFFETGVDRGVLYPRDGDAVPWNGLTNVQENNTDEVKSFWMDGVKYLDHHIPGSYSAKLEAFTYPDALEELTGSMRYAPGIYLHDQKVKVFHLSYRTKIGNDIDPNAGYKIHIVYNVMAMASSSGMATVGDTVEPAKMSWDLTGTPPQMFGVRPTAHISLHSLTIDPTLLATIEDLLYGTDSVTPPVVPGSEIIPEPIPGTDPALPSMVDLLTMIEGS